MSERWYRAAGAEEPLTQGDIIFECPALTWRTSALRAAGSLAEDLSLGEHLIAESRDLVVMTQACDLEHAKVTNAVLVWNLNFLNSQSEEGVEVEHRVVDFHEVFTLPRPVLDSLLRGRNVSRPQLLPPYREHLSQAFARFFMRLGLPTPVLKTWEQ